MNVVVYWACGVSGGCDERRFAVLIFSKPMLEREKETVLVKMVHGVAAHYVLEEFCGNTSEG